MSQTPIQNQDDNDDTDWNQFYLWGLDLVWRDNNGHWIRDEYRYDPDDNLILDWYSYCDVYNIQWNYPRLLTNWLIEDMDQHYREQCYDSYADEENAQPNSPEHKDLEQPQQEYNNSE